MFGSDEYKEVSVPAGDYVIGEDIPAGIYSLESALAMIEVYPDASKDIMSIVVSHSISTDEPVGKIELLDGYVISISFGSIVFKTYTGLGF